MRRTIVIDAEPYLFEGACSGETEVEFTPGNWMYFCNHNYALSYLDGVVERAREAVPNAEVVLAFGVRDSFRYDLWPHYKGDRRSMRRPAGLRELYASAQKAYPWLTLPKLEADDVVGVTAEPFRDVILSTDKDMRTLPGLHLTSEGVAAVSEQSADRAFFVQALAGDATDGYPGCPGIGVAKAQAMLRDCMASEDMWEVVLAAYEKAGFTIDHALVQARCARILRPGEYDQLAQLPRLWQPPTMEAGT